MSEMHGNVGVKREFQRFMNRFFYNKEESEKNLSLMYYYLDDMIAYIEDIQATIGTKLIEKGETPIEMEAIDFILTSKRTDLPVLKVLDHMGRETEIELVMKNNEIRVDGSKHKTLYYLLEYED